MPYIVIERVNGLSLQHLLMKNEPLEIHVALDIARQVCDGLHHVHANDVLHRDLKPTNILTVEASGGETQVKLIDFGLAKLVGQNNFQKLTQTGMALGSVMYASPEQCLGQPLDARSDIYSLGCVLYHMLTGYPPYTADNATAVMFQQLNESIGSTEHWSKVPAKLQPLLAKCMAKEKERRYSSSAALNEDLRKLLDGQPAELEGVPVSADAIFCLPANSFGSADAQKSSSNRKSFAIIALSVAALCVLIGGSFLVSRQSAFPTEDQSASSVRDDLSRLVHRSDVTSKSKADRVLSLIESYKRDKAYSLDRSDLVLRAYILANSHYEGKNDLGSVRRICKQALEDCRDTPDVYCQDYIQILLAYHDACVPVRCQLSLMPLLEEALKRYPNADRHLRRMLYAKLGDDYLQLERFDDALQSIKQAQLIAADDAEKIQSKWIELSACTGAIRHYQLKKDFAAVRRYCKQAVNNCRRIDSRSIYPFLWVVHQYHQACLPAHCHHSLIPLLEETVNQYPKEDPRVICGLYLYLAEDYVELGQLDAAKNAATKAASLAVVDAHKIASKALLDKCSDRKQKSRGR